jgi:hypothetical protein
MLMHVAQAALLVQQAMQQVQKTAGPMLQPTPLLQTNHTHSPPETPSICVKKAADTAHAAITLSVSDSQPCSCCHQAISATHKDKPTPRGDGSRL